MMISEVCIAISLALLCLAVVLSAIAHSREKRGKASMKAEDNLANALHALPAAILALAGGLLSLPAVMAMGAPGSTDNRVLLLFVTMVICALPTGLAMWIAAPIALRACPKVSIALLWAVPSLYIIIAAAAGLHGVRP